MISSHFILQDPQKTGQSTLFEERNERPPGLGRSSLDQQLLSNYHMMCCESETQGVIRLPKDQESDRCHYQFAQ